LDQIYEAAKARMAERERKMREDRTVMFKELGLVYPNASPQPE